MSNIVCQRSMLCAAGGPAEFVHTVRLGGGYGQAPKGLAFYYYCADCHDEVGHDDTDMSKLTKCDKIHGESR